MTTPYVSSASSEVFTTWRGFARSLESRLALTPITFLWTLLAVLLAVVPSVATGMQFDREAFAQGELSRLLSGHLTHWTLNHACWDVAMFLALGALCEARWPRRFAVTLAGATIAIPLTIWLLEPDVATYRGLSGIDSALFTLAVGCLLCESLAWRRRVHVSALAGLLAAFAAKVGYEYVTGATLFVDSTEAFVPIPLAHVVGGAIGLLAAFAGPVRQQFANSSCVTYP